MTTSECDYSESYEGGSEIDEDEDEDLRPEDEDGDASSKTTMTAYSLIYSDNLQRKSLGSFRKSEQKG